MTPKKDERWHSRARVRAFDRSLETGAETRCLCSLADQSKQSCRCVETRGIRARDERAARSTSLGIDLGPSAVSRRERSGVEMRDKERRRPGSNVTGTSRENRRTGRSQRRTERERKPTFSRKPQRARELSQGLPVQKAACWLREDEKVERRKARKQSWWGVEVVQLERAESRSCRVENVGECKQRAEKERSSGNGVRRNRELGISN